MDGSANFPDPSSPDFVNFGHYRVARRPDGSLDELGKGAMGVTYRAYDPRLRIPVALKVIAAAHVHDERARRRFEREASAAAQLSHPNVASVKHLGEQGGEFFYAMEFIAGRSLSVLLKEEGKLPPPVALALMAQVAAALSAAHRRELIHRDLKPSNLMLLEGDAVEHEDERTGAAGRRQVKVIDFGLARTFGQSRLEDSLATHSASAAGFTGTPAYASPEQCAAVTDLDGRADLYSLGIILWQCLAGRLPFVGSASQVIGMHQYQPPPLAQLDGLPALVVELISGLLDKDPDERRPPTAGELRDRLDALRREALPVSDPRLDSSRDASPAVSAPAIPSAAAATLSSLGAAPTLHDSGTRRFPLAGTPAPTAARSRWPAWLGALLGVVLVAVAALLLLRSQSSEPLADASPTPTLGAASPPAAVPAPAATPNPLAAPTAKRNFATALAQLANAEAADKSSLLGLVATAKARTGDIAGAKTIAATIAKPEDQAEASVTIVAAQTKAGDIAGAKATAAAIANAKAREWAAGFIVAAQAKAGDLAAAKATAAKVTNELLRAKTLSEIAVEQVNAGDADGARATVAATADPEFLALSLARIARAQAMVGDVAGAKATAATIRDPSRSAFARGEIAAAQAGSDDIEGAKATLASVKDASPPVNALIQIAVAQAKAGDTPGARATAAMLTDASDKRKAAGEVAVAQAKAGNAVAAKATAAEIDDASAKDRTLSRIAMAQAFAGDLDGAKATAVTIGRGNERSLALRGIAAAQAWGEGIQPADAWANSFDKPRDRFYACLGVAEAAGAMALGRAEPELEESDGE